MIVAAYKSGAEVFVSGLNLNSSHLVRVNGQTLSNPSMVQPDVVRGSLASLPPGVYDVQVVNGSGNALATLKGALTAAPNPAVQDHR